MANYKHVNEKAKTLLMKGKYGEAWEVLLAHEPQESELLENYHIRSAVTAGMEQFLLSDLYRYLYNAKTQSRKESRAYLNELKSRTNMLEEELADADEEGLYTQLVYLYTIQYRGTEEILLRYTKEKLLNFKIDWPVYTSGVANAWNVLKKETEFRHPVWILIESIAENNLSPEVLARVLARRGDAVYFINTPVICEVEGLDYNEEELINITLQNEEQIKGITYLTPLMLIDVNTQKTKDTTSIVLLHILQTTKDELHMFVIEKEQLESINANTHLHIQNILSGMRKGYDLPEDNEMHLLKIDTYESRFSKAYQYDIEAALEAPDEVKISIVIATRNNPDTLRYTLLSCLDQDYEDYEIILSDNGDPGDQGILALAEELNAKCIEQGRKPLIKYYHTPGPLPLPKSYEFAYLHARGEFIFGLGSDDAVMPNSLKYLARCIGEYPDCDVIKWERSTYFWPNMVTSQKNFLIHGSKKYKKGEYAAQRVSSESIFAVLLQAPHGIYGLLPLCYINSGMRRRHIKKIIEKTGTFIGGVNQDVYLGVLNLYLNPYILAVEYPFTMAGQSGQSIGAKVHQGFKTEEELEKQREEWNKYIDAAEPETRSQALMPLTNWDTTIFVNQLLKVKDLTGLKLAGDDTLDFKTLFKMALEGITPTDINYEAHVENLRIASKLHGKEFKRWFKPMAEKAIKELPKLRADYEIRQKAMEGKSVYEVNKEGDEAGFVYLNASEYEVKDVYAAAKLADSLF